jgi:hypothetical protein
MVGTGSLPSTGGQPVEQDRFERLVVLMRRMSEGDRAAMFTLADEFGAQVVGSVRAHLRDLGVDHVERDDLDGLAIDACEVLYDLAGTWRPDGGALPWVWAAHRMRAVASRHVGQHADVLDERAAERAVAPVAGAGTEPDELALLATLAARLPECALLQEALTRVTTPRNQAIVLAVRVQELLGDPAPAATVGREFGLRADAVRQIKRRTLQRLRTLATDEPRFLALADLPLLAA